MNKAYWIPATKRGLIEALSLVYPGDKSFRRMKLAQLYAIFYRVRNGKNLTNPFDFYVDFEPGNPDELQIRDFITKKE